MYLLDSLGRENSTYNASSNINSNNNTSEAPNAIQSQVSINYDLYTRGVKTRLINLLNFIKNIDNQIDENKHLLNLYDKLSTEESPKKTEKSGKFFKRKKNIISIEKESPPESNEVIQYKTKNLENNFINENEFKNELKNDLQTKSAKLELDNWGIISSKKDEYFNEKVKKENEYNYMLNRLNEQYNYYISIYQEHKRKYILKEKSLKICEKVTNNLDKNLMLNKYLIHEYYLPFLKVKKALFNQQRGEMISRLMREQEKRYNSNNINYYSLNNNDKFNKTLKTRRKNSPSLNISDKCINSSTGNLFILKNKK